MVEAVVADDGQVEEEEYDEGGELGGVVVLDEGGWKGGREKVLIEP